LNREKEVGGGRRIKDELFGTKKKNCSHLNKGRRYIDKSKLFVKWRDNCCFLFFAYISAASFRRLFSSPSLAFFLLFVLVFFNSSLIQLFVLYLFAHCLYLYLRLSPKVCTYNQLSKISIAKEILATYTFDDKAGFSGCRIKIGEPPSNDCYWFDVKRISNLMFDTSDASIWMSSILNILATRRKIDSPTSSLHITKSPAIP